MKTLRLLVAAAIGAVTALAAADEYQAGSIRIEQPWVRPTVAGQRAGGGYLSLENRGAAADRLLAASAEGVAARVELHSMSMDDGVMRMRQVDAIALPPGASVALQPGGYHLMFMELKAPLERGSRHAVTLKFERAGEVRVEFEVRQPGLMPAAAPHPGPPPTGARE